MKINNRIRTILIGYIFPILTISLFFVIRIYFLDNKLILQAFSILAIFVLIHSAMGGFWSGLLATFYGAAIGTYLYILPLSNESGISDLELNRVSIWIFTGVLVALFTSTFATSRKQLKKATVELNKTTKRLRRVMDSIFTMIAIVDREGTINESNKSYANALEIQVEDLNNRNIFDLAPWNNNTELQELLKKSLLEVSVENPIKFEHSMQIGRDVTYAEVTINVIKENRFEEIVLTMRDRTDRKKYEDELLKSKEILSRLIDANIIGMAVSNLEGEFIETNDEFLEMLGYTPEEFVENGLNSEKITPTEYSDISQSKVKELLEKGYMNIFEKEFFHRNGSKVSMMVAGVMINSEQALCLMLDLTPQKNLQQKKDEFISVASHELKTPMTVIKGYLQLLSKKLSHSKEDYSDFLNIIDFQLNKMNSLVNELHDMSKIESNKLRMNNKNLNLNELVCTSIKEVNPFINSHEIKLIEEVKDIYIKGDIIRLEQVMLNLLTNAIKYSPDGGEILVTVNKDDKSAFISVKDYGVGIPKDLIKSIFTKFFQVEEKLDLKEGLGLGLYISSEIIKQHKGSISVDSKENEGSTFIVKLPLA